LSPTIIFREMGITYEPLYSICGWCDVNFQPSLSRFIAVISRF
jgi:hypothetical protein